MANTYRVWVVAALALITSGCFQSDYAYMKEGESYARQLVQFVGWQWNADELISKADPRMLQAFPESEIKKLMSECSANLGILQHAEELVGAVSRETQIPGKSALYTFDVQGQKGNATIRVKLQKQDDDWKVLGFWVQIKGPGNPQAQPPK